MKWRGGPSTATGQRWQLHYTVISSTKSHENMCTLMYKSLIIMQNNKIKIKIRYMPVASRTWKNLSEYLFHTNQYMYFFKTHSLSHLKH